MNLLCCTIATASHINKAVTMLRSFHKFYPDSTLYLFTVTKTPFFATDITCLPVEELFQHDEKAGKIVKKYGLDSDETRWSLKPVILSFLLARSPDPKVIYCDCDICFFRKPVQLVDSLDTGGILLTPHWRALHPTPSEWEFRLNFQDGLFNAGCIAVNSRGREALDWWVEACLFACEANREKGLWHDQRYLDLMIIHFTEVIICRDKSYNVAEWNHHERKRFLLAGHPPNQYPITFVHFTTNTIGRILKNDDPILKPYYDIYCSLLEKNEKIMSKAEQPVK